MKNKVSRQMERAAIRAGLENRLRSADFQGARVAIRDDTGKPVIHRPERARFKSILRDAFKHQWKRRVQERVAEREGVEVGQ